MLKLVNLILGQGKLYTVAANELKPFYCLRRMMTS